MVLFLLKKISECNGKCLTSSGVLRKCLESAVANAENNHDLDIDELVVSEAFVGKNLVLKRGRPRARGRYGKILKPFSQLTIKVRQIMQTNKEEEKV